MPHTEVRREKMKELIVVKVGGNALDSLNTDFFEQLHVWQSKGKKILLIHGGGPMISKLCQQLDIPVLKKNGVRVTDEKTLTLTKLVLLGQTQPLLLQKLSDHQLAVSGLNAAMNNMLEGTYLDENGYGQVGVITSVNQEALTPILNGKIGVLAPLALTKDGNWLNVNADEAAAAVASLLGAQALYLMTDVAGVLDEGKIIRRLNRKSATDLTAKKIITKGMQPKIKAAFKACSAGVKKISITNKLQVPGTIITKEDTDDDEACIFNV